MKYATLLLGFTILIASVVVAAAAPLDRECYHKLRAGGITVVDSKRICSKEMAKPDEMGWSCDPTLPVGHKDAIFQAKGGFKHKRDVECIVE
jgi:hypothetical protein